MAILDRKLKIFRMAARLKHFSEAAAALGMSQPNVTQQMAQLEKELHTPLFDRSQRQLELTPAGEALLAECERLFAEVDTIRRRIHNAAERIQHYRIGGTMTAGGYILPEYTARYMQQNVFHNIGIHVANTLEVSEMLKSRALDLALVEGPFDRNYFLSEKLQEDELVAVSAPGTLPEVLSLADYIKNSGRFVLRESGSGTRHYFDIFLTNHGLEQPREETLIEVNSFDAIKNLVRGGHGMTVISTLAVADEIHSGVLAISRFTEGEIRRNINFIYTENSEIRFVEGFIRFCRASLKRSETGEKQ